MTQAQQTQAHTRAHTHVHTHAHTRAAYTINSPSVGTRETSSLNPPLALLGVQAKRPSEGGWRRRSRTQDRPLTQIGRSQPSADPTIHGVFLSAGAEGSAAPREEPRGSPAHTRPPRPSRQSTHIPEGGLDVRISTRLRTPRRAWNTTAPPPRPQPRSRPGSITANHLGSAKRQALLYATYKPSVVSPQQPRAPFDRRGSRHSAMRSCPSVARLVSVRGGIRTQDIELYGLRS